ncbi:potassium translocating ATPase, subunit B [Bosea sp. 62]|uniref:potassium-transporting ATPase subunit KdpB n=1 Tax=unclassified Bosea (in: a-proteobacteria) TaxID=2653178 RepID=UPI001253CE00|nr:MULTISPECIES: potassium-transporting ATPase subunit KdpB [unclassified Bosea (in: a-proteobacteria)]CAD5259052.1 potassium translocating ATPase, subunit B [Bosea sp. 46]CAD5263470.1 potassium translocating ATPase, subunit B [Bosea sp. 21B]CAD5276809.1 potassium translocating ATPase, subunit B [Bosea sp. 7B]VVT58994.1 potassium translocating ATPase, subunit B [Bosea sp. EC-HK365B]VXB64733.1 potassium translocating ATPase, subunit B [Bosea sp. 29B]
MSVSLAKSSAFSQAVVLTALKSAFNKLDPRELAGNPVILATEVVAALATVSAVVAIANGQPAAFPIQIAIWLWLTVVFANFAEAIAEGRGKAAADSLRATRVTTKAKLIIDAERNAMIPTPAHELAPDDIVLVEAGDVIPADGEIIEGVASVNEAAITGESAPVIRESGGDRSAVTGGTTVVSDWIKVRVTSRPGSSFLDRMIAMVEGADRRKTPNELALAVLLAGLTLVFLIAVVTLTGLGTFSGVSLDPMVLGALFVTLIPTTIGGLLSAVGIAGMDRLLKVNVLATSGRAVEAAGDVDTLLLDKTGTITFGNRMAVEVIPVPGVRPDAALRAALMASLADETPEGRSIVELARNQGVTAEVPAGATTIPFSATTRQSGLDLDGKDSSKMSWRKGAVDAVIKTLDLAESQVPAELRQAVDGIARSGGTPLAVSENGALVGVIHLKDVVKPGVKERFADLRRMGVRTVMITGDNPVTAAAIASEAGVDDFLAEATPEDKLRIIRTEQAKGRLVAMCGDGANDAPALAQADVGVAMQTGAQAAREAGNMVDLDSDPTKVLEIVEVGKQLLITRGALTTFSIANDVAKYFAIIPALFVVSLPALGALNIMGLSSPQSAILSAVIFNALVIVALIPLALKGVRYRAIGAAKLLSRNLTLYGIGGIIAPFIGIKLIDLAIAALKLV